jgi:hypothetical protein
MMLSAVSFTAGIGGEQHGLFGKLDVSSVPLARDCGRDGGRAGCADGGDLSQTEGGCRVVGGFERFKDSRRGVWLSMAVFSALHIGFGDSYRTRSPNKPPIRDVVFNGKRLWVTAGDGSESGEEEAAS